MAIPVSKAELLPPRVREVLNELLISGKSLRQVADATGLSYRAVNRYKKRIILPALKTATKAQLIEQAERLAEQTVTESPETITNRAIARDIANASPFRDHLDRVRTRIYGALERAETDPNTPAVALSPLFAQAHKNLELLGRATGELVEHSGTPGTLAVQMMNVLMLPVTKPACKDDSEPAKIVNSRAECDEEQSS